MVMRVLFEFRQRLGAGRCADSNIDKKIDLPSIIKLVSRRRSLNGQRMNPFLQQFRQRRIHHPVLLDPRLAAKGFRHDIHPEMAFAIGPRAGMAGMLMRFVDHIERRGAKALRQALWRLFVRRVPVSSRCHLAQANRWLACQPSSP